MTCKNDLALLLKIEKDCKDIEKFKEKSALVYVFQFMFFWKKHYTDRGKFLLTLSKFTRFSNATMWKSIRTGHEQTVHSN